MRETTKMQKGFSGMLVIILIAAVAVAGLVIWRVYDSMTTQGQTTTPPPASTHKIVKFQSFGLEVNVPNSLAEQLVFVESTTGTPSARMSAKDVAQSDPACGLEGGDAALGVLFKVSGTYPTDANAMNAPGPLLKQFSNFYVAYRTPQQACSLNKTTNDLIATYLQQLKEALPSIAETK